MSEDQLQTQLHSLLTKNQRHFEDYQYTVPSPELYPFQWLWDSCFHAFMYNALGDTDAAKKELTAACARPLSNGLLPHIIYWHQLPPELKWGREQRSDVLDKAMSVDGTSTLTQPPIIARAVYETFEKNHDSDWLTTLFPTLCNYFDALALDRTYKDTELVVIINPDESGEDNSPRYDSLMKLTPHHTADEHLDKRMELMNQLRVCDFKVKDCMQQYFAVIDVGFNAIYLDGLQIMNKLALSLDDSFYASVFGLRAKQLRQDMLTHLQADGEWYSYDVCNEAHLKVSTWNEFMPLFVGLSTEKEAEKLVKKLYDPEHFFAPFGIRTTNMNELSYDPAEGFWRGPVWAAPYWFITRGLHRYGYHTEAVFFRKQLLSLIEQSGWREHYHPDTGAGLGATNFTWSGLVAAM